MAQIPRPRYGDIFAGHDEGGSIAEQACVLWEEYKADLEARGLWNRARARTLDRLVRMTAEYLHYQPLAVASGPVRDSKDGGQYADMLWSQVKNMADQIAKLEKSLTLTPESVGAKTEAPLKPAVKTPADEFLGAH
ncbi:Phage terminase, small subunit [Phaeobacter inhibens]|uniref:Phage terminase, small subunit n=1 Tax=Phaeobacter inhibens TaxID=221822 RepID=A0ABN5GP34_9RHOB|nr:P27 family phage terminase small subunit [Phaeobacter inhibens]AUQ49935.1 Phage terminase, small subunit [Phaeobacter inhibens]AUQ94491.1 Phage terminase, small subunit [Phaeobacter inhibens]AUR19740.1 Phage terminase, small subunit [Phaeobacter inhibens]